MQCSAELYRMKLLFALGIVLLTDAATAGKPEEFIFNEYMVIYTIYFLYCSYTQKKACTFNLDTSSPTYPPHLVDASNTIVQPTLINGTRVITLAANQQVTVACEGASNVLTATGAQLNNLTCVSGSALNLGSTSYAYSQLGCKTQVKETVKETTGACSNGGTQIEIGWQVGAAFINQLTICHVKSTAETLYSIDTIYGASIAADDKSNTRPSFRKGNYYTGVDVDTAYSQAGQNATVRNTVGSSSLAAQYIDLSKSYYFARGHFA